MKLLAPKGEAFGFQWSYYVATESLDPAVSDALLHLFVERCNQLHNFGLTNLSMELIRSHHLHDFELFSSKARLIFELFKAKDFDIPARFKTLGSELYHVPFFCTSSGGSVFHQSDLPLTATRALFNAGFRNVDIEYKQLTPLMCLKAPFYTGLTSIGKVERLFMFVEFLVSKRARLDREIPPRYIEHFTLTTYTSNNRHRVIYWIASLSWVYLLEHPISSWHSQEVKKYLQLGSSQVWKNIMTSIDFNPCLCACSSDGCRPVSLALKMFLVVPYWAINPYRKQSSYIQNWEQVLGRLALLVMVLENLKLTERHFAKDVIRLLTFSALGLTHTCCEYDRRFQPLGIYDGCKQPEYSSDDRFLDDLENKD